MSKVLVTDTYLSDIADAIREKNETETTYKPSEMAQAISEIETDVDITNGKIIEGYYANTNNINAYTFVDYIQKSKILNTTYIGSNDMNSNQIYLYVLDNDRVVFNWGTYPTNNVRYQKWQVIRITSDGIEEGTPVQFNFNLGLYSWCWQADENHFFTNYVANGTPYPSINIVEINGLTPQLVGGSDYTTAVPSGYSSYYDGLPVPLNDEYYLLPYGYRTKASNGTERYYYRLMTYDKITKYAHFYDYSDLVYYQAAVTLPIDETSFYKMYIYDEYDYSESKRKYYLKYNKGTVDLQQKKVVSYGSDTMYGERVSVGGNGSSSVRNFRTLNNNQRLYYFENKIILYNADGISPIYNIPDYSSSDYLKKEFFSLGNDLYIISMFCGFVIAEIINNVLTIKYRYAGDNSEIYMGNGEYNSNNKKFKCLLKSRITGEVFFKTFDMTNTISPTLIETKSLGIYYDEQLSDSSSTSHNYETYFKYIDSFNYAIASTSYGSHYKYNSAEEKILVVDDRDYIETSSKTGNIWAITMDDITHTTTGRIMCLGNENNNITFTVEDVTSDGNTKPWVWDAKNSYWYRTKGETVPSNTSSIAKVTCTNSGDSDSCVIVNYSFNVDGNGNNNCQYCGILYFSEINSSENYPITSGVSVYDINNEADLNRIEKKYAYAIPGHSTIEFYIKHTHGSSGNPPKNLYFYITT